MTGRAAARLRRWNLAVGGLHALQAALILALAGGAALPVTASWLEGPPGSDLRGGPEVLFDVPIGPAVAAFLALAAVDHLLVAGPLRGRYERWLAAGRNPARWWEYSVSASLMVVLIAMLSGVSEASALIALFGANAAMILFGLVMEAVNRPGAPVDWRPFRYGCLVGAVPWIAIAVQLAVGGANADVPGFVVAIFASLFVLFNSFAANMWLQFRGRGRWRDPLVVERVYLGLSLVAKSALAWQVFAGALAG
ncbi:MAG TPA: heliorhodopsin HeR [Solirubrobacteraceae bacterium]|nr:heliorhodopsin HeR [Solirubrobacteraceae bacterium]